MYLGTVVGIFMIGYVRVSFSSRQQKSPGIALDYNDREKALRKAAIIILAISIALALIPTKNL